jgi:hypothetical protein
MAATKDDLALPDSILRDMQLPPTPPDDLNDEHKNGLQTPPMQTLQQLLAPDNTPPGLVLQEKSCRTSFWRQYTRQEVRWKTRTRARPSPIPMARTTLLMRSHGATSLEPFAVRPARRRGQLEALGGYIHHLDQPALLAQVRATNSCAQSNISITKVLRAQALVATLCARRDIDTTPRALASDIKPPKMAA